MSRAFVLNDPYGPRLHGPLAAEIGLKESILLLQIEFWVSISKHKYDGFYWTYQTISDFQYVFPFMGRETIRRVLHRLEKRQLIISTDKYNKFHWDRTRWYTIDPEGCEQLESLHMLRVKDLSHFDSTPSQNEPTPYQNEPTIPEEYSEDNIIVTHKPVASLPDYVGDEEEVDDNGPSQEDIDRFDDWFDDEVRDINPQPFLVPAFVPKEKRVKTSLDPIPSSIHALLYRLCFRADSDAEVALLSSTQRGRVASVAGELRDNGADLNKIPVFEQWWLQNWRSKDRGTGQYQAPRPNQILEHWTEAMKSGVKPVIEKTESPKHSVKDLSDVMRNYRNGTK